MQLPKAVIKELEQIPLLEAENERLKLKAQESQAEYESAHARLTEWEDERRGALEREQELLDGLGWRKNA